MPMNPDVRAALLFALWHHQGGSSQVGQPIRSLLDMGQHERMPDHAVAEAKRVHSALAAQGEAQPVAFDLIAHIERAKAFSEKTFGPGARSAGVVDHIRKELREIEAAPHDLEEWVDVVILALDGAWRAGFTAEQIAAQIVAKQTKNEGRAWPDWRKALQDKAIEHDRSGEATPPAAPSAEARDARPVAWEWFDQQGEHHLTADEPADYLLPLRVTPLFAATPPAAPSAEARDALTQAALDVLAERRRQVEKEGWTPEHDDEHGRGELALAAECYCGAQGPQETRPAFWPWTDSWWKPKDRRHNLVRAGALMLAEIERLDRAALAQPAEVTHG